TSGSDRRSARFSTVALFCTGLSVGTRLIARATRRRGSGLGIGDRHHGGADHLLAQPVTAAVDLADDRVFAGAVVLDRLVEFGVELLAGSGEGREPFGGQLRDELVGEHLQRAGLEIAVLTRTIEVVEDREELFDQDLLA